MQKPVEAMSRGRATNRLLDLLSDSTRSRVLGNMQQISAKRLERVFSRHVPTAYADFPVSAVVSLVTTVGDDTAAEVATIGNEGMAGLGLLFGGTSDAHDANYQIPGRVLRMSANAFRKEVARHGNFEQVLQRYAHAFNTQLASSIACSRLHNAKQRLCACILLSHDRVGRERIELTQASLAEMLGVLRPSATIAAGALQNAGSIVYHRGTIDVLDRKALEAACCGCYAALKREFGRLLR